jgi:hypothetical protein
MTSLFQILMLLLNIVWFIIIAHVIMSWLINFQVLNLRQPLVAQIWDGLNRLLEPVYGWGKDPAGRTGRDCPPPATMRFCKLQVRYSWVFHVRRCHATS